MKPSKWQLALLSFGLALAGALAASVSASADDHHRQSETRGMDNQTSQSIQDLMKRINSQNINFGTYTPDHHKPFERLVFVGGPPEVETLISLGKLEVLDALVDALKDKRRAWAAQVMLSKLTHMQGRMVDAYSTDPRGWYRNYGNAAHAYWTQWLEENRTSLRWDPDKRFFVVVRVPDGGAHD